MNPGIKDSGSLIDNELHPYLQIYCSCQFKIVESKSKVWKRTKDLIRRGYDSIQAQ